MSVNYKDCAIVAEKPFHQKVLYDVSNNLITAQFDGCGAISRYAVMNRFSVFSAFYTLFSFDGEAFDWSGGKRVTMIGRRQVTEFETEKAEVKLSQFLDNETNAVYFEAEVTAKQSVLFNTTVNFGIDYGSYVQQLFTNRLSAKNLLKVINGFIFKKKKKVIKEGSFTYIRNDLFGDYYLDFAVGEGAETLEAERNFYNQLKFGGSLNKGETRSFRFVLSAGTRGDYTYADVMQALKNFDAKKDGAESYIGYLKSAVPPTAEDGFHKAYYASLLNCSLSNYKELGSFKGFLAGIVYQFPARTYYRDAYWTVLSVLPVKPELVKNEIITLANGIDKKTGECPSAVKFNFKNYWGNHYDSPSFFVMMVYDYVAHTGDRQILNEKCNCGTVLTAAEKVMDRLLKDTDETGLLVKSGSFNRRDWCDNVFRGGYVTYDEALYARALFCMSGLYGAVGDAAEAKKYLGLYEKVKTAINGLLWNEEKGYYVNYKTPSFTEDNLSVDTVTAVLFGIADKSRGRRVLENMERLLESKNNREQTAGDFGTLSVYPFYKNASDIVQKSSLPYCYHNGADWPYLSCMYAYAKFVYGMDGEYPLTRWFTYNIERGNYTPVEFFSPIHKDGSLLQAWSSTGAFALSYKNTDFFAKNIE